MDKTGLKKGSRMILFTGPMGSGKTTQLVRAYQDSKAKGYKCFIFDNPYNNRNSARDLVNLVPDCQVLDDQAILNIAQYKNADILYFDEVHMYSAFGQEARLLDFLKEAQPTCVVCSGLWYDFYKGFENPVNNYFRIWDKLSDFAKLFLTSNAFFPLLHPIVRHQAYILSGCFKCGEMGMVKYSANLDPSKGRVGDHYANCCLKCAKEYYAKYVEHEKACQC